MLFAVGAGNMQCLLQFTHVASILAMFAVLCIPAVSTGYQVQTSVQEQRLALQLSSSAGAGQYDQRGIVVLHSNVRLSD